MNVVDNGAEIEIVLRSASDVADRVIMIAALCRRAFLETRRDDLFDVDPLEEYFDLCLWLREENLESLLTDRERDLIQAPLGEASPGLVVTASWQTEALVALGWGLGLTPVMPLYDHVADPACLMRDIPSPWEKTASFRQRARLRDEAVIATAREEAELWYWRAEAATAVDASRNFDRASLTAAIRDVAREALGTGVLPTLVRGDFPVQDLPYRDVSPTEVATLAAIAASRLRALNWLCGFGSTWDDAPLDV
jgi:hypothetical protein